MTIFRGKSLVLLIKQLSIRLSPGLIAAFKSFTKDFRLMGYCSQDAGEISGSLLGRRCGRGMVSKCIVLIWNPTAAGITGVWETRFESLIFDMELKVWDRRPFKPICYKSNICIWK